MYPECLFLWEEDNKDGLSKKRIDGWMDGWYEREKSSPSVHSECAMNAIEKQWVSVLQESACFFSFLFASFVLPKTSISKLQ